ncbi:Pre-mRNA-splicing factor syf2 [Acropora cervicornis]|uniref:Pre-mRNA-splicing factor SYF2 n=1 Tax=Acropora cervicornis TaxID=6130 RepID=A0AAD9VDJ8_ACRCE|nr:Pre-mRNA-splicing factor syf2 [Acropora cervicornis]
MASETLTGTSAMERHSEDQTETSSSGSSISADEKRAERMKRLRELHLRRNEARKLNHQEVAEEDRRKKLPANWEVMQRRVEWENKEEEARKEGEIAVPGENLSVQRREPTNSIHIIMTPDLGIEPGPHWWEEAEARGENYDRVKLLETTAEEADKFERKRKKKNPDEGFSDFATAQYRQYQRLTKQMKPSTDEYRKEKEQRGEAMFPSVDDVNYGGQGKVPEAAVDRMVADLEKHALLFNLSSQANWELVIMGAEQQRQCGLLVSVLDMKSDYPEFKSHSDKLGLFQVVSGSTPGLHLIEKREKYSRRRAHHDEADIDYINERNMKFNQKLARFYDPFTSEIKQNLERGTAI